MSTSLAKVECPVCGKKYKPEPAYRHEVPVCDPFGFCGGVYERLGTPGEEDSPQVHLEQYTTSEPQVVVTMSERHHGIDDVEVWWVHVGPESVTTRQVLFPQGAGNATRSAALTWLRRSADAYAAAGRIS